MKLPSFIPLPWYMVMVREVSDADMREMDDDGGLPNALWDVDTQTIFVRRAIPKKQRGYALYRELRHALTDAEHHHLDGGMISP